MSKGMDKLAKGLRNAMKEKEGREPKAFDTQATVLSKEGDTLWVHIPGGVDRTPVKRTVDAEDGDQIMVRVADGRAWAIGNATNPPTDGRVATIAYKQALSAGTQVGNLNEFVMENSRIINADIENVKLKNVEMENVMAQNARITNSFIDGLTAEDSDIRNSKIEGFTVIDGVVQGLQADRADINGRLTATEAVIEDLDATYATIDDLEANYAHITQGVIDNAKIGYADVNDLNTHYAGIDLANVNNAWIQNGVVKDAAISDAQIIGVSANKLTAGTIDASRITVTNLNADNITVGTINGQRIGNGSLSLDKLSEEVPTKEYLDNIAENLQGQIDGQIETWTGNTVPTLQNSPAVNWTETSEKHNHVGDIYYVVNAASEADGYTYRFTESGTSPNFTYSWTLIKDNQITKALQDILDMQGDISGIKSFDTQISSWKTDTDEELSSLKSRTSTLETNMGTKVSTTTFNELSQTVDENSASITSLSETIDTKADSSTVTTLSNTVNEVSQTATNNSSKISNLTTVLGTNADGTTKNNDIVHRMSAAEQDLGGFKTTVSETYQTKDAMSDYSTTSQMNTAIQQSANSITTSVSQTYATKTYADTSASTAEANAKSYADDNFDVVGSASTAQANAIADASKKFAAQFATSSTASGTTAKTATIVPSLSGWALYTGAAITVKFTNANTSTTPTLNINSTGAKQIRNYSGSALTEAEYKWPAGATMSFVYDGTYWRIQDSTELIRLNSAETSISQTAEELQSKATKTEVEALTGRVSTAESTITQHASDIEAKVSKDGVIAAINLSTETEGGSAVKISADKVNIEGATIFTSGRLSTNSLNSTYDAFGTASGAISDLTTDLASATGTTIINGGHISTGSIEIGKLNTDAQNTITNAATTASSYITYINATEGIKVHNSGDTSNYAKINSNGMEVYKDGNSVADFSVNTRVGVFNTRHIEIKDGGLQVYQDASTVMAHIGYGSGNSQSGTANAPYYTFGERKGSIGNYSIAEGVDTTASGYVSHAEGYKTTASGHYGSHAEGDQTTVSGQSSHAEGSLTIASGLVSHAEGEGTTASGDDGSHAEGVQTTASGHYGSHAEGYLTIASGQASHASGYRTIAEGMYQTAIGAYNISDTTSLFIIGNGTSSARSNALTVGATGALTTMDDVIAGNGTQTSEVDVMAYAKAGKIYLYSTGTTTGNRGIFANNASGTGRYILYLDQNNNITYSGGYVNGSLSISSTLSVSGSLSVSSWIEGGAFYCNNANWYYSYNSAGTARPMVGMNSSNQYFFGYSGYVNSEGSTYFDGNVVHIRSNSSIYCDARTIFSGQIDVDNARIKNKYGYTNTISTNNQLAITTDGYIGKYASSSIRYKELIEDSKFDPHGLYNLHARQFKYKDGYFSSNDTNPRAYNIQVGFIAEEINKYFPEATIYDGDEVESWDERKLIPPMLQLIQEQHKEIEDLKMEVQKLKWRMV
jgi:hypothetical protein